MRKRLLAMVLTVALCLCLLPAPVFAETSGVWEYYVSSGEAIITGWTGSGSATIPSKLGGYPVTIVGSAVFDDSLTSLSVPASVRDMGALSNCSNLRSVSMSSTKITALDSYMFYACYNLTSVSLPSKLTSIGSKAFTDCEKLTSISIPSTVTSIGESAFEGCGFKSLTIPNTVKTLGKRAYAECLNLTTVKVGTGITVLNEELFEGCEALSKVTLSEGLTTIGSYAFGSCSALKEITLPETLRSIYNYAFWCSGITTIHLPASVSNVAGNAFQGCGSHKSYTVDEDSRYYTAVDGVLFNKNMTTLVSYPINRSGSTYHIPHGVVNIGTSAFVGRFSASNIIAGGNNLSTLYVPATVKNIGSYGIYVTSISKIYFHGDLPTKASYALYMRNGKPVQYYAPGREGWTGGSQYSAIWPDSQHATKTGEKVAPICGEGGYTLDYCAECGYTYKNYDGTEPTGDHVLTAVVAKEPNCATGISGNLAYWSCSVCEKNYLDEDCTVETTAEEIIIPAEHDWQNATCTVAKTCTVCGETDGDPLGHHEVEDIREATCTEDGGKYRVCDRCDYEYLEELYPAAGHDYEMTKKEPTCEESGGDVYTCSVCGDSYVENEVPATGHSHEKHVSKEPTCTEKGSGYMLCHCGDVYPIIIQPTGHDYVPTVTDPSCADQGYTTHTCANCGDSYVDSYVDAKGHDYEPNVIEPTCTEKGYTTHTCSVCGDSYVDSYVNEKGHDYDDVVTAPTCTAQGYTNHICSVCGSNYVDSWVPATGHSWDAGVVTTPATEENEGVLTYTCTVCGETKTEVIPAVVHTYDGGVVTTEPTCTESGVKTFTCIDCGKSYTEEVPALRHNYGSTVTEPTCSEKGYTTYTCSRCGDSYKDDYVDEKGHSYQDVVTEPTCTELGYTTHICRHCGDSYISTYIGVKNHNYDEGKITTPAKYMTPGEKTFTCQACGHSYTKEVARLTVPFTDVEEGRFYYTPMLWALDEGVTTGATKTTFDPTGDCTRGQVVTFLWRAAGCPEPTTTEHPFTDVREKGFYYKAMLWAVQNGITAGTSKTTFEPDAECTRAQVVTFLWRAQGKPAPVSDVHNFTDVSSKGFYYKAMLWAVENGITAGTSKTKFSPEDTCNRGQVVTFLYRVYN